MNFPSVECLQTIYTNVISGFLKSFADKVGKVSERLVNGILALHKKVSTVFLPKAVKFHYIFNLRDLSNIVQGILFGTPTTLKEPIDLVRAWLHESTRVYGDKLITADDRKSLVSIQGEIIKEGFEKLYQKVILGF